MGLVKRRLGIVGMGLGTVGMMGMGLGMVGPFWRRGMSSGGGGVRWDQEWGGARNRMGMEMGLEMG